MTVALLKLKRYIRTLVPADFAWTFDMDGDVWVAVRFRWIGQPGANWEGSIGDPDLSIMLDLLRTAEWDAFRAAAIEALNASEANLLRIAQEQRAARLLTADAGGSGEAITPIPTLKGRGVKAQPVAVEEVGRGVGGLEEVSVIT